MHSFTAKGGTTFNYNGGFDGAALVRPQDGQEVEIPVDDLLEFVAEIVRQLRVRHMEDQTASEILGIPPH